MIDYSFYQPTPKELAAFVATQRMGRLVTASRAGQPTVGLYPYLTDGDAIELHLVKRDTQVANIRENPRIVFEVDEVLSYVPSYFEDPDNGTRADNYYRVAILEGSAQLTDDADALADHLRRLIARYQPEGKHRVVTAADPMYASGIAQLVMIRLQPTRSWGKFKLGQQRPAAEREYIAQALRSRARPGDDHTANLVDRTLVSGAPDA